MYVAGYGCTSAAGENTQAFWDALSCASDLRRTDTGVCAWLRREGSSLSTLASHLQTACDEALKGLPKEISASRWGVVLASTKGHTEDVIWNSEPLTHDPIAPVLPAVTARLPFKPARKTSVSNACASSHGALFLAAHWISRSLVDSVLVLAADEAGRFVQSGFKALGALSPTGARPFSADRDGLQLGEAAAALVLSRFPHSTLHLDGVALETEGSSVTRPALSGQSLKQACRRLPCANEVDLVIAHGTATLANDAVEDKVYRELFGDRRPAISGTKWCIGHTLGASGVMDLIAACESLKRQELFALGATKRLDPGFRGDYLLCPRALERATSALVVSLGFGGVNAAAKVSLHQEGR